MELLTAPVSTYIVAQNPEVLAQLMKESQARGVCPSVYTTPATPFNSLAVQFQDDNTTTLTTAIVADLPFADTTTNLDSTASTTISSISLNTNESNNQSESNLDSIESTTDTISSFLSNLSVSETQSPNVARKQTTNNNLYGPTNKITDHYSPVQKSLYTSNSSTGSEIYGPVANFSQSSVIVGHLSQSPSLAGNFDACSPEMLMRNNDNYNSIGPSSLPIDTNSVQNDCSASMISQNHQISSNPNYSLMSSSMTNNSSSTRSSAENIYGPVLKFRTSMVAATPISSEQSPPIVGATYIQNSRSSLAPNYCTPVISSNQQQQQQTYNQGQPIYPKQGMYSNNTSNVSVTGISGAPIYTVHATPTSVVQAQKLQQQAQQHLYTSHHHHHQQQHHQQHPVVQTRQIAMPQVGKVYTANAVPVNPALLPDTVFGEGEGILVVEEANKSNNSSGIATMNSSLTNDDCLMMLTASGGGSDDASLISKPQQEKVIRQRNEKNACCFCWKCIFF